MKELLLVGLLSIVLVTSGCVIPGTGGILQIKITDQAERVSSLVLTISDVKVHAATNENLGQQSDGQETNETDSSGWMTVVGAKTIDLVKVKGIKELLGETTLPEGKYTQIRLSVSSATAIIDGVTQALKIPSKSIKFIHPFEIQNNATTSLIIDFDADNAVIKAGNKYILKPVVRISTEFEPQPKKSELEKACTDSGGTVTTMSCCKSVKEFPNACLIGACGCSLENSHEVKACDCGEGKCWNGNVCVTS
jgi:hypothetical protein